MAKIMTPDPRQTSARRLDHERPGEPLGAHGPGETVDEMMAEYRSKRGDPAPGSITTDPITGTRTYTPVYQPRHPAEQPTGQHDRLQRRDH
jgi:hypothetical protein